MLTIDENTSVTATGTFEQFCEISKQLLSGNKIDRTVANVIANTVWNKSQDIRDGVRIDAMAKSIEDVEFIVDTFVK
jgi:primase-polymerase (primpol)-like protein